MDGDSKNSFTIFYYKVPPLLGKTHNKPKEVSLWNITRNKIIIFLRLMVLNLNNSFVVCLYILIFTMIQPHRVESESLNVLPSGNESAVLKDNLSVQQMLNVYVLWKNSVRFCSALSSVAENEYGDQQTGYLDRIALYKKLFPGILIESEFVKSEIVIEKYLQNSKGIIPSPEEVDEVYNSLLSQLSNVSLPPKNEILSILQSRALFKSPLVSNLCRELVDQKKDNLNKQRAERNKKWGAEKLEIRVGGETCLVSDPKSNECVVTTDEFNTFLQIESVAKRVEKKIAREMVLKKLLNRGYFARITKEKNIKITEDEREMRLERIGNRLLLDNLNEMSVIISDAERMSIYEKYYNRFFRERKLKTVAIIGSSDSLLIDSLYRTVLKKFKNLKGAELLARKKAVFSSLPWVLYSSESLPDTIVSTINGLHIQDIQIVHTPFGHFICRLLADKRLLEIRPDEARQKLVYLALKERERSNGESDSLRAISYYEKNLNKYCTPDTFVLKTWLVPQTGGEALKGNESKLSVVDTPEVASMEILSITLPPEVEIDLMNAYKKRKKNELFLGPITSKYGNWYFKVKLFKKGGEKLPFDTVKAQIFSDMQIQRFPIDSILKTKTGKNLIEKEVRTEVFYASIPMKADSIPEKEVEMQIKHGKIILLPKMDKKDHSEKIKYARQKIMDDLIGSVQKNANDWIKSLVIDEDVLFSGCESHN